MTITSKIFLVIGSLNAMLAVMLGAFAAHGLKNHLTQDLMAIYQTAVQYHFFHALGLLVVGLIALHIPSAAVKWSGWLMVMGILLFSGSLYLLAISGTRWLGMITPFGGICFITAWALLAWSVYKQPL